MAPSIPTHRPLFTSTRVASAVALLSVLSSVILLVLSPTDDAHGSALACAAMTVVR